MQTIDVYGAREMAQLLKALVSTQGPGLTPRTHMAVHNLLNFTPMGSAALFWPPQAPGTKEVQIHTFKQTTHT